MLNVMYPLSINHNDCEYCFFIHFKFILVYDVKLTWCINKIENWWLQFEFFIAFKSKYLDVEVAFPKFHALKPWWVHRLTTRNKCCCHYHQEVELFVVLTPQTNVSQLTPMWWPMLKWHIMLVLTTLFKLNLQIILSTW